MYTGLRVKCPLLLPDFNAICIFSTGFRKKKNSNITPRENPSSGSRVAPVGRADGHTFDEAKSRFSDACDRLRLQTADK